MALHALLYDCSSNRKAAGRKSDPVTPLPISLHPPKQHNGCIRRMPIISECITISLQCYDKFEVSHFAHLKCLFKQ